MGKYSHLLLPRIVSTEPSKQDKVNLEKAKILEELKGVTTAASLAARYAEARKKKDALKSKLSALEVEVEASKQLLIEKYDEDDIDSLRLSNDDTIRVQLEPYLVIESPTRFRKWCVENGWEESLQLPWATANSLAKALLLKGKPEPEGTRAYFLTKAVYSPGGKSHTEDEES